MSPSDSLNSAPAKKTLRTRAFQVDVMAAFATLIICTVLFIVFYTYHSNSKVALELSQHLVTEVTSSVIDNTTAYMKPAEEIAQLARCFAESSNLSLGQDPHLEVLLHRAVQIHPQLAMFYIGDRQGNFLMAVRKPDGSIATELIDRSGVAPRKIIRYRDAHGTLIREEVAKDASYDPRKRPWYKGVAERRAPYWTDIYVFYTGGKPGITAAVPALDRGGELQAVVAADITLDKLSSFLGTLKIGESGVAFILNEKDELVAHPDGRVTAVEGGKKRALRADELNHAWVDGALAARRETAAGQFSYEAEGKTWQAYFSPFPKSFGRDWTIAVLVPEDDFIGPLKATHRVTLTISFLVLLVAIGVAVLISRNLSRPIEDLTAETARIKDLDLSGEVRVQSPIREIQTMCDAIGSMKAGLRAFEKYVPADLVRQLVKTGEDARLGGEARELTIFFSDIASFTSIAERMHPEELMLHLSAYLDNLTQVVKGEGGTVDKYIGDSIMAFWGAPVHDERHAHRACAAALGCIEALSRLNPEWEAAGRAALPTRIGIHTGETMVGNVGSSRRMNYTVMGDSVNLASRLEGV
ncbi:MAG: cache domain-containing protein, partial [Planctomycetota bacterium]